MTADPAAEAVSALRYDLTGALDVAKMAGQLSHETAAMLVRGPIAPLLADIAALRTRAEEAERVSDEHELRADRLERERRLMDARVHHQRTTLREVDATACRIKELERDRGRAWAKACASKADLIALARMYGEACGMALAEWMNSQADEARAKELQGLLITQEICADRLATELAEARAENEPLRKEASFLLSRLAEFENGGVTDDSARDWFGHVRPSMGRLIALTTAKGDADV